MFLFCTIVPLLIIYYLLFIIATYLFFISIYLYLLYIVVRTPPLARLFFCLFFSYCFVSYCVLSITSIVLRVIHMCTYMYICAHESPRAVTHAFCMSPPAAVAVAEQPSHIFTSIYSLTYLLHTYFSHCSVCLSVCLPVVIVLLCLVSLCSLNLINTQPFIMRCALTACIYPTATPAFERKKREKCWLIYYVVYTYPGSAFHFAPSVGVYIILRP